MHEPQNTNPGPDDLASLAALLADDTASPFRPTQEVLIAGVSRSDEFQRILALPRRAETVSPEIVAGLTRHLKTDTLRVWGDAREVWHATYARLGAELSADTPDDEVCEAAFDLVPTARHLPEVAHRLSDRPDKPQNALRPIQARAIADAYQISGLFAPIGVGHGKFLISVLLIQMIEDGRAAAGLPPLRWLLLVPASVLPQTIAEITKAKRHWRVPSISKSDGPGLRVATYDKLSRRASAQKILDDGLDDIGGGERGYQPDAVVIDECHKMKRTSSGRTKLFLRYFRVRPETTLFAMSGSVTKKSIRDYWHLIKLALPRFVPLPRTFMETEAWSQALDDAPSDNFRRSPGALLEFCNPAEVDALQPGWSASPESVRLSYYGETPEAQQALLHLVRRGFQSRLLETPGVVGTSDGALASSLVIRERVPPLPPAEITRMFEDFLRKMRTPNDDEIDGGVSLWRYACEMASGFWYQWIPAAPPAWLAARQDWHRYVRRVLQDNRQRIDTPMQVAQAVDRGTLSKAFAGGDVLLQAWREVRDSFEPNPVAQWISTWLVEDALRWIDEQKDDDGRAIPHKCVIWVGLDAVGQKIEELSGGRVRYFGGGAKASLDILTHNGPIVCSIAAHGTGKNLQRYSRNLVIHWPGGADIAEQLCGRTHRPGQDDDVVIDVYLHALEFRNSFDGCLRGAEYIERTTGASQKISYASIERRGAEDIAAIIASRDPLWYKPRRKK